MYRRGTEPYRAEPDRHARPRRLPLRSLAIAGLLRRRLAAGRCVSGRRGPDRRQRLRRDGPRSDDHSGHQQDRPEACAGRRSRGGDGAFAGRRARRGPARQRQDGRGDRRAAGRHPSTGFPPPQGDPQAVAAGDGVRLALRRVSRCDHLCADHERARCARARRSASCAAARRTKCWKSGSSRRGSGPASSCRPARSAT